MIDSSGIVVLYSFFVIYDFTIIDQKYEVTTVVYLAASNRSCPVFTPKLSCSRQFHLATQTPQRMVGVYRGHPTSEYTSHLGGAAILLYFYASVLLHFYAYVLLYVYTIIFTPVLLRFCASMVISMLIYLYKIYLKVHSPI